MSLCTINRLLQQPLKLCQPLASLHSSSNLLAWVGRGDGPKKWLTYNDKVYPPQTPDEEPRPAVSLALKKKNVNQSISFFVVVCLSSAYQHQIQSMENVVHCFVY